MKDRFFAYLGILHEDEVTSRDVTNLVVLSVTFIMVVIGALITARYAPVMFADRFSLDGIPRLAGFCIKSLYCLGTLSIFAGADVHYHRRIRQLERLAGLR